MRFYRKEPQATAKKTDSSIFLSFANNLTITIFTMEQNEKPLFTSVNDIGEFGLIKRLTRHFSDTQESTVLGIGDDAAILSHPDSEILVSTDMMVEGIHFDLAYTPLKHLGYKAVTTNLSDIYAMNGLPKQITVSIAVSSKFSVEALEELYSGIETACQFYDVDLVGGDTTTSRIGMIISVTAIGAVQKGKAVLRSGAKVDDLICVTGDLGASYLGLQILEREKAVWKENQNMQPKLDNYAYLAERFLKPEASKFLIELFEKAQIVPSAMLDVSDGLSSELMHICAQSDVGAFIYEDNIPINEQTYNVAVNEFKISPTTCALNGGEDYELLFTLPKDQFQKIDGQGNFKVIGNIQNKKEGIKLYTPGGEAFDITAQGWNHFE